MFKSLAASLLGLSVVMGNIASTEASETLQLTFKSSGNAFGINYRGNSVLKWQQSNNRYNMSLTTSSLVLSYTQSSSGLYSAKGLKPLNYKERSSRQAYFDYDKGVITFKGRNETSKIQSGAQDRVSAVMQLRQLLMSGAIKATSGGKLSMQIAGSHSAPVWHFAIGPSQQIHVPLGTVKVVQVSKTASSDGKKDVLRAWLMPERDWLPAKLEFDRGDKIYVLMELESIK